MQGIKLSIFTATLVTALASFSNTAQAEFCKKYKQTSSNAGQCNNCFVTIKSEPSHQLYGAIGSNGWYAETHWVEGDNSIASGGGFWRGAPKNEKFEIDLEQQGSTLRMTMQMYKGSRRGALIKAKFVCVQP